MAEAGAVGVVLPCGYLDKAGKVIRDAEIVAMTGLVRKNIARPETRQNPNKVIDSVLWSCVKRLGENSKISGSVTDRLLAGDRDFLSLKIRELTYGPVINAQMKCSSCNEPLDAKLDVRTIKVRTLPDDAPVRGEHRVFTVEIPEKDIVGVFRYPTGADQAAISATLRKNPVEASYKLYLMCLQEFNGKAINEIRATMFDDMPLPTLDAIDAAFRDQQPGPDMRETIVCGLCGAETPISLEVSDFLFPLPTTRNSETS